MARDLGPDMLANLDRRLAAGEMTPHEYDARRTEVTEAIRRGKTVELTTVEQAAKWGLAAVAVIALIGIPGSGGPWIAGVAVAIVLILLSRLIGRTPRR